MASVSLMSLVEKYYHYRGRQLGVHLVDNHLYVVLLLQISALCTSYYGQNTNVRPRTMLRQHLLCVPKTFQKLLHAETMPCVSHDMDVA